MTDERLESVIEQILAIRDTVSVRSLCCDLYALRDEKDTDEAVKHAEDLLAGVKRYKEHDDYIHRNLWGKPDV